MTFSFSFYLCKPERFSDFAESLSLIRSLSSVSQRTLTFEILSLSPFVSLSAFSRRTPTLQILSLLSSFLFLNKP